MYTQQSFDFGGAMDFRDGRLWVGKRDLWLSRDTGRTWRKVFGGLKKDTFITNIDFADALHGIVTIQSLGPIRTSDGGLTWNRIDMRGGKAYYSSFFYLGSSEVIIGRRDMNGACIRSSDGGLTWNTVGGPFTSVATNGSICGASGPGGIGYMEFNSIRNGLSALTLARTTDFGETWDLADSALRGQYDSYGLTVDLCDPNRVYLANEDAVYSLDGNSNIFVTNNRGDSWTSSYRQPCDPSTVQPSIAGNIVAAPNAIYAQSRTNGILRSVDRGRSWTSIGGPNIGYDTRMLVALSDQIIFAVDSSGSVWMTDNSGGYAGVPDPHNNAAAAFSSDTIIEYAMNVPIHLPIRLYRRDRIASVEFCMHYSGIAMRYLNATSIAGDPIDTVLRSHSGSTTVRLRTVGLARDPDSVIAHVNFLWRGGEVDCEPVMFDSVQITGVVTDCGQGGPMPFHGYVGSSEGCLQASVPETELTPVVQAYPVPATRTVTLRLTGILGLSEITLLNELGQNLFSDHRRIGGSPNDAITIDITSVPPGAYILRVDNGRTRASVRIVVAR